MAGLEPDEVTVEAVIDAGLAGDPLARRILEETGEYLGLGIVGAINVLDPELVVLGGSTMRAGKMVLEPATRVVRNRALPGLAERARIVIGELGEDVGAASMLLRGLFAVHVSDGKTSGSGVPESEKVGQRRTRGVGAR